MYISYIIRFVRGRVEWMTSLIVIIKYVHLSFDQGHVHTYIKLAMVVGWLNEVKVCFEKGTSKLWCE